MRKRANGTERLPRASEAAPRGGMSILDEDRLAAAIYGGEIFWELRDGATGKLQGHGSFKNVVTKDASILVARLLKSPATPNLSEPAFGVFALAVGTGDAGWNPLNPPVATVTQRSLYNELARKQITVSDFIDGVGAISGVPTNVVDFTTTFSEAEAVGALTEMGLLGGDVDTNMAVTNPILPPNGTYDPTVDVVGKDTLVNYKTMPVINKPATSTLSWTWRITTGILLWIMAGSIWSSQFNFSL